jgi:hypothetical protein
MKGLRQELRAWGGGELVVAAMLVAGVIAPAFIGFKAWVPSLVLVTLAAAAAVATRRRTAVIPWVIVAYIAVYALAGLHGLGELNKLEAAKYFGPPVLAVAIATLADTQERRGRLLVLMLVVIVPQVLVTAGQAIALIAEHGRELAVSRVDQVTGTLGPDAPGTVTLVCMLGAVLCLAAALAETVSRRWAALVGTGLLLVGVFSSTRAVYLFIPAALLPVVALWWLRSRARLGRVLAYAAVVAVLVPASALGIELLYPGANVSVRSKSELKTYLNTNTVEPKGQPQSARQSDSESPAPVDRTEVLPGRVEQVRIALRLSVDEGPLTMLLGRGLGATSFKDDVDALEGSIRKPGLPANDVERTNGLWVSRTLTEAGWAGIAAFAGLLAWALFAAVRIWRRAPRGPDRVIALALPGVAGLTFAGGFYITVLAVQPYASVFWLFVGLALAAVSDRRPAPVGEESEVAVQTYEPVVHGARV